MRFDQVDTDGTVAVEQWWTMVLLGLHGVADLGSTPADHRFPDGARERPVGSATHHRAAGYDFVFAHGLCTMAICTHRLLHLVGVDDPSRVRRVAVRFASPTPLDCDLTVNAFAVSEHSYAFEAETNGTTTITHGRLELRS